MIMLLIIALFIKFAVSISNLMDRNDHLLKFVMSMPFTFFGVMICMLIASFFPYYKTTNHVPIVSLASKIQIEGRFTLGSGIIKGKEYFFYFEDLGDNKYKRGKILAKYVVIKETNQINPRLQWKVIHHKVPKWFGIDLAENKSDYVFIVPEGTVIKQFNLI